MSDSDDYVYGENDNEQIYGNERNYLDRVGPPNTEDDAMDVGVKGELQDSVQKFASFVYSVATTMSSNDEFISLSKEDIQFIMRQVKKIPTPEYKNPTGYVIGYWLVNDKKNAIDKKRYTAIKSNLKNLEYPLEEQDIIRYARFWIKHNLLKI